MTIQIKKGKTLTEQERVLYDILQTYSRLDIYTSPDFAGLKKEERISKIMEMINGDERFSKLDKNDIGAILTIGIGETLCLRTSIVGKDKNRLYRFSFDNDVYSEEYPLDAKKLIGCCEGVIGEHIRGGLTERLEGMLLETGKVNLIKQSRKEIRIKRKRMHQLLKIEGFDENLVYELKERGYSLDIIREMGKDPLLKLDSDLIERVLSK